MACSTGPDGSYPLLEEIEADSGREVHAHFVDRSQCAFSHLSQADLTEALNLLSQGAAPYLRPQFVHASAHVTCKSCTYASNAILCACIWRFPVACQAHGSGTCCHSRITDVY